MAEKPKRKYLYLVVVQLLYRDTGVSALSTVDVAIDFRITKATVPVLLEQMKKDLSKQDHAWSRATMDPNTQFTIMAFSKYEE